MFVGINSRRMAVGKRNLNRVLADRLCRLCPRLGLEHGQRRGARNRGCTLGERFVLEASVVAGGAGTFLAQIDEIEVARVPVRPGNVHTRSAADVNLHAGWLAALIDRIRHKGSCLWPPILFQSYELSFTVYSPRR